LFSSVAKASGSTLSEAQNMANRDIVVIGGSAGALEPLREIFSRLPADLPASIYIVLHVSEQSTFLPSLIGKAGRLPVEWAKDKTPIELSRAYVAVPGSHLLLLEKEARLTKGPRENRVRPSIDVLFRSAAVNHGSRAIGVLLSGYQNDGVAGLVTIKEYRGIAIVQDPADALVPEMPHYAMQAAAIDHVGIPSEIAMLITHLVHEEAEPAMADPQKYDLELRIAQGEDVGSDELRRIADAAPLTCSDCGGVLSQVREAAPLRFRCQVGHAITGERLLMEQGGSLHNAMTSALRLVNEHAELLSRLAVDARNRGGEKTAVAFQQRSEEHRQIAQTIRKALTSIPNGIPGTDKQTARA
jgi:two-component system chemotaxis response regulator CheB